MPHQALHVDKGDGRRVVLFLDLDGFKEVNDGFGHGTGDALLAAAGARIVRAVRAEDVLAAADSAMYLAKDNGRARYEIHPDAIAEQL